MPPTLGRRHAPCYRHLSCSPSTISNRERSLVHERRASVLRSRWADAEERELKMSTRRGRSDLALICSAVLAAAGAIAISGCGSSTTATSATNASRGGHDGGIVTIVAEIPPDSVDP